jgi:hypothetical protein
MPTFPTYDRELPKCLNPLNPRHYLLVLYWVFFRPTALKCYLYQASPEIYKSEGGWEKIVASMDEPAYKNLICMCFLSLFTINFAVFYFLVANDFNSSDNFISYIVGWTENQLFVANKIFIAVLLIGAVMTAFGIIFGYGIRSFRLAGLGSTFVLASSLLAANSSPILFALVFTFFISIIFLSTDDIPFIILFLALTGFCLGITVGWEFSLALTVAVLRLPYYFFQLFGSLLSGFFLGWHPILEDELIILPLPKTHQYLLSRLLSSTEQGLNNLAQVIANPFQAWAVHNAAWSYLEQSESPIADLYSWSTAKELNRYVQAPIDKEDFEEKTSSWQLLFAELAGISLSPNGEISLPNTSNFPRFFTTPLRCQPLAGLQELALLFLVFSISIVEDIDILKSLKELQNNSSEKFQNNLDTTSILSLKNYEYHQEILQSFNSFLIYLLFQTTADIATAPQHLTWLNPTDIFLRPTVIQALQTLSQISQEVNRANIASSPLNQRNAILIANDSLEQLTTYVTEQVHPNYPEQKLLLRIIDQWQSIITKAGGELGRAELLEPIENPYIAGPPVTGSLFVGREDIFTQLEELWLKPGQVESVVLYGHRRMGKTSILRNLPGRLTPTTKIINFNAQSVGVDVLPDTKSLIFVLAQILYDDLPQHIQNAIPEPLLTDFLIPTQDFRRFLKKVETHREPNDRFIIAIDEFELLDDGMREGRFIPSLISHWRGILTEFHWIIFAFAGLHTLQEKTQDYWQPLFGNVHKVHVSFLSKPATTRLITNPSEDFPIDYDPDAIDLIYHLTHGQPYLTQLICQNLITRFNRQRFEEQREIEPRFTIDDINTIITEPNFFNDGNAYFRGIWEQAQETQGPAQLAILQTLIDRQLHQTELADRTQLPPEILDNALQLLIEHDVIHQNDQNQYHYRVELMRQWVLRLQQRLT